LSEKENAATLTTIEPVSLRRVMSQLATGVVVLSVGGEHANAMTANAFTSLSLDPPMVLCCVARHSSMHRSIQAAGGFGVSILSAGQQETARRFASRTRPRGAGLLGGVLWRPGPHTGAPLLADSLAWVECSLEYSHEGGDHTIFVGQVRYAECGPDEDSLLFFRGAYGRVS
jgi:flavin reductase (DIM6/NTAB) family NADH-FMN oxidoreductase RutF